MDCKTYTALSRQTILKELFSLYIEHSMWHLCLKNTLRLVPQASSVATAIGCFVSWLQNNGSRGILCKLG